MNKRTVSLIAGGLLLLVVLVAMVAVPRVTKVTLPTPTPAPTQVSYTQLNVLGGLIFQDSNFIKYLHEKYQIDPKETMMGSFAQADTDLKNVDCTVPGSLTAADYFQGKHPGMAKSVDTIMRTYIVVYTWRQYLPTLKNAGLVTENAGVYMFKIRPVLDAKAANKNWSDLHVDIPGPVNIEYTDPLKSSSGMVYLGMQADYLVPGGENGGKVVTAQTLPSILPALVTDWNNQGRQENSSPDLFKKFLASGPGKPMIVNYESAYPAWYVSLSDSDRKKADQIVGLYPEVTVNTDHILFSLTDKCLKVKDILLNDPWVLNEAWTNLGMRGPIGEIGSQTGVTIPWLSKDVSSMSEPKKDVSDAIQAALK